MDNLVDNIAVWNRVKRCNSPTRAVAAFVYPSLNGIPLATPSGWCVEHMERVFMRASRIFIHPVCYDGDEPRLF